MNRVKLIYRDNGATRGHRWWWMSDFKTVSVTADENRKEGCFYLRFRIPHFPPMEERLETVGDCEKAAGAVLKAVYEELKNYFESEDAK